MVPTLGPLTFTVPSLGEESLHSYWCKTNLSQLIFLDNFVSIIIFPFRPYFLYLKLSFLCFRYCLNLVCCLASGKHLSRTATIRLSSAASAEECIEIIHSFISGNGTGSSQYVQLFYHQFYIKSHYSLNLFLSKWLCCFSSFFQRQ